MTTDELEFNRIRAAVVGLLGVNFAYLVTLWSKNNIGSLEQVVLCLLAVAIPALAVSVYSILAYGQRSVDFDSFYVCSLIGQILSLITTALVFFSLSWIAGSIIVVAGVVARNAFSRDELNARLGDEAYQNDLKAATARKDVDSGNRPTS